MWFEGLWAQTGLRKPVASRLGGGQRKLGAGADLERNPEQVRAGVKNLDHVRGKSEQGWTRGLRLLLPCCCLLGTSLN